MKLDGRRPPHETALRCIVVGAVAALLLLPIVAWAKGQGGSPDSWQTVPGPTTSEPFWETSVWTGTEMLAWGRTVGAAEHFDGFRYQPGDGTWRPMTMLSSIADRRGAVTLWAGSELIVWGGANGSSLLRDGARYDPATDTWTTFQAPEWVRARQESAAAWTGRELLIFGGYTSDGPGDTGAAYEPVTDQWRPLAAEGAPGGRYKAIGAWTGTQFVVWGGLGPRSVALEDGARYDLETDRWVAMAVPPGPLNCNNHGSTNRGVWTDTTLVIWGCDPLRGAALGGRYDPRTDQWQAISNDGAPSGRVLHYLLWTGREVLVWGGASLRNNGPRSQNIFLQYDGGRYDPARDTWAPIPPQSTTTTAVAWTGIDMMALGLSSPERQPLILSYRPPR